MLSIGWPELMVVAAAALIIVGPRDLPALLRNIGQVTGRIRRMSNEFRSEINKVAALDDVKDIRKSITAPLKETRSDIESEFNKIGKDGVSPSGKLTPTDPEVESVYDRIKQQTGEFKPIDPKDDPIKAAIEQSKVPTVKPKTTKPATKRASKAKPARSRAATSKSAASKSAATKSAAAKKPARTTTAASAKPATAKPAASKTTAKPKAAAKPQAAPKTPAKPKAAAAQTAAKKPAAKKPAAKPRAPRKQPASKA